MPKVSEEYITKKKIEIIDAAFTIFQRKPLYEMNMLEVIKEAGLSKGGIYRYYNDIDDVIVELINRETIKYDYKEGIEKIISSNDKYENIIKALFEFLGKHIDENAMTIGKIQFELTVLEANQPEKAVKILSRLNEYEGGQFLINSLHQKIAEGVATGEFKPNLPVEDIYLYIRAYIEGVVKIVVFERCYGNKLRSTDAQKMVGMLAQSVLDMLRQRG